MNQLNKEELQERIAKYETWIDGARRFLKYANDDLENPNYSQFEKDQAEAGIFEREPILRQWEKEAEILKLALKQLEDQKKCCANCADWEIGREKNAEANTTTANSFPCESRKIYDLHEEYGYIVTPPDFYCGYWRKDV